MDDVIHMTMLALKHMSRIGDLHVRLANDCTQFLHVLLDEQISLRLMVSLHLSVDKWKSMHAYTHLSLIAHTCSPIYNPSRRLP